MFNLISKRHERRDERGQIVVVFGLILVAVVAMVGLVLDGGSAFAQRRSQQNSSDLAAMAGANTYLLTNDTAAATAAAREVSAQNGWEHGTNGVTVTVEPPNTSNGVSVTVVVEAPHENTFGAIVGLGTMQVATSATALSGFADTAEGAGPMIFSVNAFESNGKPKAQYGNPNAPFAFGETNGDVPTGPGDLAWTNYGTGNVNTNDVRQIIQGNLVINKTLNFGEYIGQHNNGNHTALFSEVNDHLSGTDIPVPIVDDNGNFMGWATFHVVSASGGSSKDVVGYFLSDFYDQRLTVGSCSINDCPRSFAPPVLELID